MTNMRYGLAMSFVFVDIQISIRNRNQLNWAYLVILPVTACKIQETKQ